MSIIQKSVRLCAEIFVDQERRSVPATALAATATAILLHHKGFFNEKLQQFVFGRTSALKRVAVTQAEDGLPGKIETLEDTIFSNTIMNLHSVLTETLPSYFPPMTVQYFLIQSVVRSIRSEIMLMWRTEERQAVFAPEGFSGQRQLVTVSQRCVDNLKLSAVALKGRAFQSDVKMCTDLIQFADSNLNSLPLWVADKSNFPEAAPIEHFRDQHCESNVHNLFRSSFGQTHPSIGEKLFVRVHRRQCTLSCGHVDI